ncbi:hypothetical protein RE428_32320 [Marinobacter nanhaiticus D15-8W]|uniref:Uncharacterized protein n=1 Tax=Marinobacter nanhaiticus D15-8W TaxID=626887 RepID=N6X0F0_9GAMM|nr:hypothetical protein [Marinobacter nanhaiticus]ENO16922.1 hypothetical protein J057_01920 [Marinobacter nanhaiticus D15-8W]BES72214.1 hypothetical protein RE428_32320 [Marinobacter nanhaiticus D15-8W]
MKYRAVGSVTISMSTAIEADSEEEALEIANSRGNCTLIDPERMGCSEDDVWVHSGEIDGVVEAIEVNKDE